MMWRTYELTVGLPQTNASGFSESRLMMESANFFWWALGEAGGVPVSGWRDKQGRPMCAAFYFVDVWLPPEQTLDTYHLDDKLRFLVSARGMSSVGAEGRILFGSAQRLSAASDPETLWQSAGHPKIRLGSLFSSAGDSNGRLALAAPVNASLGQLEQVPLAEQPATIVRLAQRSGQLGVFPEAWAPVQADPVTIRYSIDPDRDTNAMGLVYFAAYPTFLDRADRAADAALSLGIFAQSSRRSRLLARRRIAYFAPARPDEAVSISCWAWRGPQSKEALGLRYQINRVEGGELLCRSEAIFSGACSPADSLTAEGVAAAAAP